jgi:hypothetical protein
MERLRTPFFLVAVLAMTLVVLGEVGTVLFGRSLGGAGELTGTAGDLGLAVPPGASGEVPAGLAVPYLALVDGVVLLTVALMGAGLLLAQRVHARVQSWVMLIGAIVVIVVGIVLVVVAVVELVTMVTLLFAFPFGTLAYLIIWGSFPRSGLAVVLSVLMALKLTFGGALVLAQQRFVQNKGLVALTLTSLVANLVVAFLHAMVPGVLVSVTDAIAGIVVAVVAIVWAVVLLVGAVTGIVVSARATASLRELAPAPG